VKRKVIELTGQRNGETADSIMAKPGETIDHPGGLR